MATITLVIFVVTYVGLALGRVPGLKIDRTGVAILGAVAMLAVGALSIDDARDSIDLPILVILFGMMMLSVQYQHSGLYAAIVDKLAQTRNPRQLLIGTIAVTGGLSAVLTNDVVCLALTPLIGAAVIRANLPPLPFFLAIACASNIGSGLTPIGNPQNILIAQKLDLAFLPFMLACAPPVIVSLVLVYWLLRHRVPAERPCIAGAAAPPLSAPISAQISSRLAPPRPVMEAVEVQLNRWQASKALVLTVLTLVLFVLMPDRWLPALGVAGIVLLSRHMTTRAQLALVDWPLLMLFVSLFIVVRGFELSGWMMEADRVLIASGADLMHPLIFAPIVLVLSNLVSNVPAVMLLLPFIDATPTAGHALALVSTFAGNLMLVGSIANLIVAEQAARLGHPLTFRDHLKIGAPITALSIVVAILTQVFLW